METKTYAQEVVNLHTHSFYCGHGWGEIDGYAQSAIEGNLQVLGMSEHCPVYDSRWDKSRMTLAQMSNYEDDCRRARQTYQDDLVVLTGYECDYLSAYHSWYEAVKEKSSYLIFGVHDLATSPSEYEYSLFNNPMRVQDLIRYTNIYTKALESGLFLFGAHPDVFAYSYFAWDADAISCAKAILECAVDNHVALEINANGMRKRKVPTDVGFRHSYPLSEFWQMASEYPLMVVTNSDAHSPLEVTDKQQACLEFAKQHNIKLSSFALSDEGSGKVQISLVQ